MPGATDDDGLQMVPLPAPEESERGGRQMMANWLWPRRTTTSAVRVVCPSTRRTFLSQEQLISELNVYIRGAEGYFRLAERRTSCRSGSGV
jgi:hypothetical protein